MAAPTKQEVETAIYAAFSAVPVPTQLAADGFAEDYDFIVDIKKAFTTKEWPQITINDWRMTGMNPDSICRCLSTKAFTYYLPSLLIGALKENDLEYALMALLPENHKIEPRKQWRFFHDSFGSLQKDAIKTFLTYALSKASDTSTAFWQKALLLWE